MGHLELWISFEHLPFAPKIVHQLLRTLEHQMSPSLIVIAGDNIHGIYGGCIERMGPTTSFTHMGIDIESISHHVQLRSEDFC